MKFKISAACLALLLTACGGGSGGGKSNLASDTTTTTTTITLEGSVGDGPIVGGVVAVSTLEGDLIASTISDDQAGYRIELPEDTTFPVLVSATGGTDVVSGAPPSFALHSVVLNSDTQTANLNPFTTLMVRTAQAMPGGLNAENLGKARDIILSKLNFGLDTARVTDPITVPVDATNVATLIKASEGLAEWIRRTRTALADAGAMLLEDELLLALGGDLSDGTLDGNGPNTDKRIAATAILVSAGISTELLENELRVNGTAATTALDEAIRLTLPEATQTTRDVPITAGLLTQANEALLAAQALAPANSDLDAIRTALGAISPGTLPEEVSLPGDPGSTMDLVIGQLAGAGDEELNAILETASGFNANNPPVIQGMPPTSITAGNTYSFAPSASDADGDTLTFNISNKPAWASFNSSTGALTGTPAETDIGTINDIVISVSDGTAVSSLPSFSLSVTDPGQAPLSITGTSIPGYQWNTLQAGTAVFIDRSYVYTNIPGALIGAYVLQTANDDKAASGTNFLSFEVNQPVSVYIAYDSRIPTLPSWLSGWTATGAQITDTDTVRDLYRKDFPAGTITLGGNDGAAYSMYTVIVTGEQDNGGSNSPPSISGTPPTNATVGLNYSFTPSASDADGDPLIFSISNKPSWASFDSATGTLSGTPGTQDIGTTNDIVITVSDGTLSNALPAFSITVSDNATGTASLSWTPPTTNEDGSTLTDLAGYRIYHGTIQGNYSNIIDIANPSITSYIVENLSSGTHYFVVTAYDTSGNESAYSNVGSKDIP